MGYDVAVLASLKAPKGETRKWRARVVDAAAHGDWPEVLSSFERNPLGPGVATRAGALLDKIPALAQGFPAAVEIDDAGVRVAAVLSDQPFTLFGAWIAAALRALSDHGGEGRLDFIGFHTDPLALSFDLRPEGTSIREPDEAEVRRIEKTPQFTWLEKAALGEKGALPAFKWPKAGAGAEKPAAKAGEAEKAPKAAGPAAAPAKAAAPSAGLPDVILSGEVRFGKKADALKWSKEKVTPADQGDWPFPLPAGVQPVSAQDLTWQIQEMDPPLAFFRVVAPESRAFVKGALPAPAAPWLARVAAVFRSAARHGGEGRLFALSPADAPPYGLVVEVKPGQASAREATAADWKAAAADPLHREAAAHFGPNLKKA